MPLGTTLHPIDNLDICVESLKMVTVASGQNLPRGRVVQLTGQFASAVGVAGTNTGNATMGATTAGDNASIGTFIVKFTAATVFYVINPEGVRLKDGATGVAYLDQVGFTITAGGTPMVAGDTFTVAVTLSGTAKVTSFTTGSKPYSVMYDAVDASGGAVIGKAYREAELRAANCTFGTGTLVEVQDALDALDIHLMG